MLELVVTVDVPLLDATAVGIVSSTFKWTTAFATDVRVIAVGITTRILLHLEVVGYGVRVAGVLDEGGRVVDFYNHQRSLIA